MWHTDKEIKNDVMLMPKRKHTTLPSLNTALGRDPLLVALQSIKRDNANNNNKDAQNPLDVVRNLIKSNNQ